uniref:ATP synthase F0 subunit 8 n=1 Tax=Dalbulus maidis TaxID=74065 RepID=UPI0022FDA7FD|nr:ATP synthase F0 subunit 8 [Dalbulus maidis]WAS32284.1 ATP synthase F0 subunit 8 [Dalbulus maidis]
MPQMAPTWWTMIMMSTVLSLMLTITIVYFNANLKMKINKKKMYKIMKWVW